MLENIYLSRLSSIKYQIIFSNDKQILSFCFTLFFVLTSNHVFKNILNYIVSSPEFIKVLYEKFVTKYFL